MACFIKILGALLMTISDAPNCGITFAIIIDDSSLGKDTFIVQASFIMINHLTIVIY